MIGSSFSISEIVDYAVQEIGLSVSRRHRVFLAINGLKDALAGKSTSDGYTINIFAQGSIATGTAVNPYSGDNDKSYDADIVAELIDYPNIQPSGEQAADIKKIVYLRIEGNAIYSKKLKKKESALCWKIVYEPEPGDVDFSVDILTAKTDRPNYSILYSKRNDDKTYELLPSSPLPLVNWFLGIARKFSNSDYYSKRRLAVREAFKSDNILDVYSNNDEYVDRFVFLPLQDAVMLLKRARDVYIASHKDEDIKIDSIVLTVLSAHLYRNESTAFDALCGILTQVCDYASLADDPLYNLSAAGVKNPIITRKYDADQKEYIWYFPNPINAEENLAIRWHEDNNKLAHNFFDFVLYLKYYSIKLREVKGLQEISQILSLMLGEKIGENVFRRIGKQYESANSVEAIGIDSKTRHISTNPSSDSFRGAKKNTFYGESK